MMIYASPRRALAGLARGTSYGMADERLVAAQVRFGESGEVEVEVSVVTSRGTGEAANFLS